MTDLRRNKIYEWALTVPDNGATIQNVAELEKILQFLITVETITGEVLYELKYKSRGSPINNIYHNAHAMTCAITIFRLIEP